EDFAKLDEEKLQKEINSIGLYRNKSKYIIKTSKNIIEKFNGKVPDNRKDLLQLSGVGRKTANVILACAFRKNAIPVDTHVFRVSNRIGIAEADKVSGVEKQLMHNIPEELWADMHHWLIFHGRRVCKAQNPDCNNCVISNQCQYYSKGEDINE
ncbi:MAG: endonuclease III domain-containing protein, partial [bacterium]